MRIQGPENRVVTQELTGALTPTTRVPPRAGVGLSSTTL